MAFSNVKLRCVRTYDHDLASDSTRPDHDYPYFQLQEMGFQRNDAQRALDLAGGSLSGAMQLLTT